MSTPNIDLSQLQPSMPSLTPANPAMPTYTGSAYAAPAGSPAAQAATTPNPDAPPDVSSLFQQPQQQAPLTSAPDEQDQIKQKTLQLAPQIYQSNMPTGKGLKGMLQRFAYGFGQAAMHEAGLATDPELQAQAVQQAHTQAQTQLVQQQIQQMKTMVPVTLPNGTTTMMPQALAAKIAQAQAAGQGRVAQAQASLAGTALKAGYRINPSSNQPEEIPYDQLSEKDRASIGVEQATQDYKTALASGEPKKIQLAQQALQARIQHQQTMEGVAQQNASANTTRAGIAAGKAGGGVAAPGAPNMKQLSPMAQKTIQETLPVHNQIRDLMQQFDHMKDDNTPAKFFADRAKYAAGIQSDIGTASDAIAQLELNRVVGAARVLKGSSRAIQAMQMAMKHLPNVWIDSPKLIYSKLSNLDKALGQIEDSAYDNGDKNGMTANPRITPQSGGGTPAVGSIKKFPNGNIGKWDGHGYILQGSN